MDEKELTARRKSDHITIAAGQPVEASSGAGWNEIALLHRCLPEVAREKIDLSTPILGKALQAPLVIAGMTGGTPLAEEINRRLARAAHRFGLGMGVGSQRAYLEDEALRAGYAVAREDAPDAFLIANIGAPQLVPQRGRRAYSSSDVRRAVDLIQADALAVHLNFLQEAVQPEGDTNAEGCTSAIGRLVREIGVPVMAKETGAGISREDALRLKGLGVAAIDAGGVGGTSFAIVESYRAAARGDARLARMGQLFGNWGIPTAISVMECSGLDLPVIATGGVRTGLDAAKALALGATAVGVALPLLKAAMESEERVIDWVESFLQELRTAMFLVGAHSVAELRTGHVLLFGRLRDWADQRRLRGLRPD